jgi:hypothetical protein
MHAPSIRLPGIGSERAVPRGRAGWVVTVRPPRRRVTGGAQPMNGCFGMLAEKDEMVVKGLAASLACSGEAEEGLS